MTEKQGKHGKQRAPSRIVPVASNVIAEISNYRVQVSRYREKGEVSKIEVDPFKLNPATSRRMFYRLAEEAGIPRDLGDPQVQSIQAAGSESPISGLRLILGKWTIGSNPVASVDVSSAMKGESREYAFS